MCDYEFPVKDAMQIELHAWMEKQMWMIIVCHLQTVFIWCMWWVLQTGWG